MISQERPLVVIACEVMRGLIEPRLPDTTPITFMSYDYHVRPKSIRNALQEKLDALETPSRVIIGYGSCGNGIIGLEAGQHFLIIPRMHDCIAMMLGSDQDYRDEFGNQPGTYYLNKGWLDSGNEPMSESEQCVKKYGRENADMVMDTMYGHYSRLCFVSFSEDELAHYRHRALAVADFCFKRWGMEYEEKIGSHELLTSLVTAPNEIGNDHKDCIVVSPGERVIDTLFQID